MCRPTMLVGVLTVLFVYYVIVTCQWPVSGLSYNIFYINLGLSQTTRRTIYLTK